MSRAPRPRGEELITHIADALGLGPYYRWPKGLRNMQPVFTILDDDAVPLQEFLAEAKRLQAMGKGDFKTWDYVRTTLRNGHREHRETAGQIVEDEARWKWRLEKARERNEWCSEAWGPMPYAEGCRVPEHLWEDDDASGWRDVSDKGE